MALTIQGKLIHILPTQSGETARGRWVRGGFVIEYGEEYPKKAHFSLFGEEKVQQLATMAPGTPVQVRFNPESREHEGRWFTDNRAIGIIPAYAQQQYGQPAAYTPQGYAQQPAAYAPQQPAPTPAAPAMAQMPDKDPDLPF